MRNQLIDEILAAIDNARVDLGAGLTASDVIGVLEWVKLYYYREAQGDLLLSFTSYSLD